MSSSLLKLAGQAIRTGRRYLLDRRGVAAVEFGLVAPIMLLMLVGTIEASRAVSVDRRFTLVTAMVADLVSREKALTSDDVTKIYGIVDHIMKPYDSSKLKMAIIPVASNPNNANDVKIYAATTSRQTYHSMPLKTQCQSYTLTKDLMPKNANLIVVEATFEYKPLLVNSIYNPKTWNARAYSSPRKGCVAFAPATNCATGCF